MLTALQHRLRHLVDEIPEAGNVALAGGGALIVLGVVDRFTTDFRLRALGDVWRQDLRRLSREQDHFGMDRFPFGWHI